MASGRRPFQGDSSAELIVVDPARHAARRRASCARDCRRVWIGSSGVASRRIATLRYATAHELAVDLGELQRDPTSPTRPAAAAPRRTSRKLVLLGAAGLVVLLAAGAFVALRRAARGASIGSVAVLPFENATERPRDRVPERRNLGVPDQQALAPARSPCHLANVRLRLQGQEAGTDGDRPKSLASTPSSSAPSRSGARTSPSPRSS